MSLHKKIKAHIRHHLGKRRKHIMDQDTQTNTVETYTVEKGNFTLSFLIQKIKNPIILIPLVILVATLLTTGYLYLNKQKLPLLSNSTDLTNGKSEDLNDNFGPYIEQSAEICDQSDLTKTFGPFVVTGEVGQPTKSGAIPKYGETTWNYILQGEISNIQPIENGIKYTLVSGKNTLITKTTNNTLSFVKNTASASAELVPVKIEASTFNLKDKVYLYYLVKCGGNKPPLLFLEYIQKTTQKAITQNPQTAAVSAGLRSEANGLKGFKGKVKEKGVNFLVLEGGSKTIKVTFISPDKMPIRVLRLTEQQNNPNSEKPLQLIHLKEIKIGDKIDVIGNFDGKSLAPTFVLVTR